MQSIKDLGPILCIERFDAFMQNLLTMIVYVKNNFKKNIHEEFYNLCSKINFEDEQEYAKAFESSRVFVENIMTNPFGACDLDDGFRRFMHHIVANQLARNENGVRDLAIRKLHVWKNFLNTIHSKEESFKELRRFINMVDIFKYEHSNLEKLSDEYAFVYDIQSEIDHQSRNID